MCFPSQLQLNKDLLYMLLCYFVPHISFSPSFLISPSLLPPSFPVHLLPFLLLSSLPPLFSPPLSLLGPTTTTSTRPFLSTMEKRWIVFQLLKVLDECDARKICHGDIKTENVLLTGWCWVMLGDFASFKPTLLPDVSHTDRKQGECVLWLCLLDANG